MPEGRAAGGASGNRKDLVGKGSGRGSACAVLLDLGI